MDVKWLAVAQNRGHRFTPGNELKSTIASPGVIGTADDQNETWERWIVVPMTSATERSRAFPIISREACSSS
jgi:hypothetical protein